MVLFSCNENPLCEGFGKSKILVASLQLNNTIQPSEIKNILVLDFKGETVFTSNTYQEKYNTDNFSKGIYFVVIRTNSNTLTKKLVIQ